MTEGTNRRDPEEVTEGAADAFTGESSGACLALGPARGRRRRARAATWGLGWASICGPVRAENQDSAWCFETCGLSVLIVADGCGGVPYGRRAASLAVRAAGSSIIRGTAAGRAHESEVSAAIYAAGRRLAREGEAISIEGGPDGLRTTLIVLVSTKTRYYFAYIGDDGGLVRRASGLVEEFLVPQKAEGAMNVLAASLGPGDAGRARVRHVGERGRRPHHDRERRRVRPRQRLVRREHRARVGRGRGVRQAIARLRLRRGRVEPE